MAATVAGNRDGLGDGRRGGTRRGRGARARKGTVAAALALLAAGCGHAIGPGLDFEPGPRFDFRRPPACAPAAGARVATVWPMPDAPDDVVVRYLGAGGVYVGWRGAGLMTAPFFSNPGTPRVVLRRMRPSAAAVERGLDGVPIAGVGAILAGHSHYDHLGDLPLVAARAPRATLWVNRSGRDALADPYPALAARLRDLEKDTLEGGEPKWIDLVDAADRPLPFRVLPVVSDHAPHLLWLKLWMRPTKASPRPWERRRHGALGAGQPYAFVVDLLDGVGPGAAVRFRLYLQDSAAQAPLGVPPVAVAGDRPYDLAVLCMASTQWVRRDPEELLGAIAPRHALVTHYEDFLEPWGPRRGFVMLLTRGVANRFLRRAVTAMRKSGVEASPPVSDRCGPSSERWTMPLTGEWLVFRPRPR